jgi:molybdopterin-binding protein
MQLSARNQLEGKIKNVELGAVMANIKIEIAEPGVITAVITKESAEKLGLAEGDDVCAIIKSTEVIIGK